MAVLTLTVGASSDDAVINDLGYDDTGTTMTVGTPGAAATAANSGQGWRFTGAGVLVGATINSAILKLMKSSTQFATQNNRWTCANEDAAATFSSGSAPGSRAIVATIVAESNNVNETTGTVYNFPRASGDQTSFGAAIANVTGRAGWDGSTLAVINQSKQDASQGTGFNRKIWHSYDSATASSEPQLVIDYTAGGGTTNDETASATATTAASGADANVFNETAGGRAPASASGADANVFNESAGGQATGQPSGADANVFNESAGAQAPASAASAGDQVVYVETGGVAGTAAASGADASVFEEGAGGTATGQAGSADHAVYNETGGATATAGASGSAAANAIYTVTGGAAAPGALASSDHTVYTESAGATSPATITATDHVVYVETVQAAAPGLVSGAGEFQSSATVYTKTGGVQACGALGSTDSVVYAEAAQGAAPGAAGGSDSAVYGEAGGVAAPGVASGTTGAGNAPSDTSWVPFGDPSLVGVVGPKVIYGESIYDRRKREQAARAKEQPAPALVDDEALLMLL